MPGLHSGYYMPQQVDVLNQQIVIAALEQVDGEAVGATRMPGASVVGHGYGAAAIVIRRNALRLFRPAVCGQYSPREGGGAAGRGGVVPAGRLFSLRPGPAL